MKIRLLESAKEDLRNGYWFYEKQTAGLGSHFLNCAQDDIRTLASQAGVHEVVGGYHRKLLKRFPFAAYYLCESSRVDVYAVLDCRRDPVWTAERLAEPRRTE